MTKVIRQIIAGAGQLFDFSGSYGNAAHTKVIERRSFRAYRTTRDALRADAERLGRDMQKAMDKFRGSNG